MTKPYTDKFLEQHGTEDKYIIRTFTDSIDEELVWHRDRESRKVHVLEGKGWMLQHDDALPIELNVGEDHYIHKMTYHRLLKGENDLVVRIQIT